MENNTSWKYEWTGSLRWVREEWKRSIKSTDHLVPVKHLD